MEKKEFDAAIAQAYDEGQRAFYKGEALKDCPYEYGTSEMFAWDEGFQQAATYYVD